MTRWLETDTLSNQDISSALAIGAYTADADRLVVVQFFADQVAGNGDYVFYLTLRVNGTGSSYQLVPVTTAAVASGVTAIGGQSGMIAVRNGDVLTVYLDGLAGDNSTPDTTVRWFELAALRPTTPDRTLDVSEDGEAGVDWANVGSPTTTVTLSGTTIKTATDVETDTADIQSRIPAALVGGRMDANIGAISMDEVAADNLETMLDGTGGKVLSLKQLDIVNNDVAPGGQGIDITARTGIRIIGSDQGISATGGSNQALYLASSTGAATIYIEGPSGGTGSAIAISSPGASPAGTSANGEAVWIETGDGHPALRIDFGVAGGDVLDVVDSDNGDWVWDDKVFAALTSQNVRDALKLAPTAGTPAAGSIDAKLDLIDTNVDDIQLVTDSLDRSALTVVAQNDVGAITIIATVSLAATISGLTIPADWTACYWTVKRSLDDADADAMVQILVSNPPDAEDGLQVLAGAAAEDGSAGSLTVNQALGTVTIALDDASTAALEDAVELVWDVKVHAPAGKTQPGTGTATITTAVTRA